MKYAIVRSNRLNSFEKELESNVCTVINMFNLSSIIDSITLEVCLKMHFRIPDRLFNPELVNVEADTIIVFDGHARKEFLGWLKSKNNGKKMIFWCWNTVEEIENNFHLSDVPTGYEIWSYSKSDCYERNLNYNTTFYWHESSADEGKKIKNDIYFIGKDKGRYNKISRIAELCDQVGVKTFFEVTPTHKWNFSKKYAKTVSYRRVIDNISESKAILDIKVSATAGPSLRAVEAAFFKKLLITDDVFVRDFKFYNPNNILIINEASSGEDIKDFLSNKYEIVDKEALNYYSFSEWLKRFDKNAK